ncbi:MAG TPA: ATP-binding protein [Burkholderiaceae bacterium]|nr:ATP-binding protein [Burkholderiaceae bacterium]
MTGEPAPGRTVGLRWRFLAPVLSLALPLAVFATLVMAVLWHQQTDSLWERHQATAQSVSIAVAREMRETRQRVELLAGWPTLLSPEPAAFLLNAEDLLRARRDWRRLLVVDERARTLLLSPVPPDGAAGSSGVPETVVRRALETGRVAVSDLYVAEDGLPVAAIAAPTVVAGQRRVLVVELRLEWFDGLLADFTRDGNVSGLFDEGAVVLARSTDGPRVRGRVAPERLRASLAARDAGRATIRTFDDRPADAVWVPVAETPWRIVLAYPTDVVLAPLQRQLAMLAALGGLASALGVLVALRTSRRLRDAIDAFGRSAAAFLEGRQARLARTGSVELDRLGTTLSLTAEKLHRAERERDELLAREIAARASAEAANRTKDEFLAMLAHELRNPLAPLTNALRVLDRTEILGGPGRRAIEMAKRQSGQLVRLVDDLLEASRITRGLIELRRERLPVEATLRLAAETAASEATARGHALVVEPPAGPLWIDADPARVAQMLGNLLGNAIKYTPDGGRIVVSAAAVDGAVELRVSDDGIGIDPDRLGEVFDLFRQIEAGLDRAAGGLGIGLALVDRLARLHGGSVRAHSEGRGRGATFTLRLPAA